ncbi:MAG: hypothetical protein ABF899_01585 [Oenococcus sp.]|uniref:hypothetical protein n=1 Tax=Oenococcus sp. TaxID=1979414 RepID=UPI0039EA8192
MNENYVLIGYKVYRYGMAPIVEIFAKGSDREAIIDEAVKTTKDDDTTEVHFIYEDIIKKEEVK